MSLLGNQLGLGLEKLVGQAKSAERELLTTAIVIVVLYWLMQLVKKLRSNSPPGPRGLPFVGYMPYLKPAVIHEDFTRLARKYGDVFSLRLGNVDVVVLNGVEVVRDAFGKPEFLGRPKDSALNAIVPNSPFFVHGGGQQVWREHRRFVVQTMKDLGLGKTKIEGDIQEEIHFFLEVLKSTNGEPTDPRIPLSPSVSNNICALVFGKRYKYDDIIRKTLDEGLDSAIDSVSQNGIPTFFPFVQKIPFYERLFGLQRGVDGLNKVRTICREEVERHRATLDDKNIRDYIDSYLVEKEQRVVKDPNTTFSDELTVASVIDLFIAGSETVRTTLHWFLYVIATFPKAQERIHREIDEVVGIERFPEYVDHKSMPYTQAVIYEIMRWKTIVPINVLRVALADSTVQGYDVKKGTLVMANLWAVHHDPRLWKDPDEFQPERFLSEDGRTAVKSPNFMPFSIGKRACPGEPMALMEAFLYFTAVLQKFEIRLPEGATPSYDYQFISVYRKEDYKVRFISRNH